MQSTYQNEKNGCFSNCHKKLSMHEKHHHDYANDVSKLTKKE